MEEGTVNNQQHPLLPCLVADGNGYITYESSAGPEYGDSSRHCLARAVKKHCTPSLCEEVRQRSDRVWEGGRGHSMEKAAWQHVFALQISTNKCRKSHSSYLMLVKWKLPYVVFGVYYILIPICPCFCWFTMLQHACE